MGQVFSIMTAETARIIFMPQIVRMGCPIDLLILIDDLLINILKRFFRGLNFFCPLGIYLREIILVISSELSKSLQRRDPIWIRRRKKSYCLFPNKRQVLRKYCQN